MKWLRFPRTLGIVVCLYLIGMSVIFGMLSGQNYRFVHHAQKVSGTVTALVPRAPIGSTREPTSDARMVSKAPTVRYEVGGASYEYTAAHGRYRQRLQIGDTVTVLYDPKDPAVARIRGEGQVLIPLITSGFVASAVLVAAILFKTRNLGVPATRRRRSDPADPTEPPEIEPASAQHNVR